MDENRSGEISPSDSSNQPVTKPGKPDYRTELTQKIIEALEAGTAPWQKPWDGKPPLLPFNAITNKPYQGCNSIWLSMQSFSDPRWATYKQATELGWQVRKGQKSAMIEYWKTHDLQNVTDEKGKPVLDDQGQPKKISIKLDWPRVYRALVFNAQQMDNVPPLDHNEPKYEWDPVEKAERIIDSSTAIVFHDQRDRAFYILSADEIHLPDKSQFESPELYYGTALHELGHWTGHPLRLNRDLTGGFGSESYAREELRAELSSYFLAAQIGVTHDHSRHASYVGSWVQALKDDPNEIFRASRDAEKMVQYLVGLDRERAINDFEDPAFKPRPNPQAVLEEGVFAMNATNQPSTQTTEAATKPSHKLGSSIYELSQVPDGIQLLAKEQFGQRVELYTPRENGGPYKGEIVNTPTHLLQEVGPRAVVIHDKAHIQLASKTLVLRDQEHRLNNTDVQIHYMGNQGKVYPLDRQKDMLDRTVGSIKKSAKEMGYAKEFIAQLDAAQDKTLERLKSLRQGISEPTKHAVASVDQESSSPKRSR